MSFEKGYFNIGYLDNLSYGESFLHRLDPRAKILVSFVFILCVVSFPKYAVPGLLPFFFYPVVFFVAGNIPLRPILTRVALLSPFVVMIGVVNPLV
ncbi:MAG: cobalt ECF transporter T component CbiQ, partial [Thermodesulfovibrionales bacterium]